MREKIIKDLLQLSKNPYGKYTQIYKVNGHTIDFNFSQKMMCAVRVDNCYRQVFDTLLDKKVVIDSDGEHLTQIQYILKSLDLEYADVIE